MKKMTDAEIKITEQQWIAAIKAQAAGADTVDEWCKKQGCTRSTFYRWKAYLKEKYDIDFDSVRPEGQVSARFRKWSRAAFAVYRPCDASYTGV